MTDGGGYDNSSVGYPRGKDERRRGEGSKETEEEKEEKEEKEARRRRRSAKGPKYREPGNREGRRKEDVCPLAMIIAESHRTWKDRKNDSPSAVSRSR
ncbi:unnamed protein product [Lasius platythorax]|uniref:Uncharacterized protein n=1 Tax=Lasius platythorax TaxID=488582 RepID=A0AAV2P6I0_9HYME